MQSFLVTPEKLHAGPSSGCFWPQDFKTRVFQKNILVGPVTLCKKKKKKNHDYRFFMKLEKLWFGPTLRPFSPKISIQGFSKTKTKKNQLGQFYDFRFL